ncbi:MAG: DUF4402 domain-containing protein [Parerythrobacter sp.]
MSLRFIIGFLSGLLAGAGAGPAIAAPGEGEARGTATARIAAPLGARTLSPLDFGAVESNRQTPGAVVIGPDTSGRQFVAGAKAGACDDAAPCAARPARFAITGEAGREYRITLPDTAIARSTAGHGATLRVAELKLASAHSGAGPQHLRLDHSGRDMVYVGGTLFVHPNAPAGHYTAQIEISVAYN